MPLDLEPRRTRWTRRFKSIPLMLLATAIALIVAPAAILLLATLDLVTGRYRVPAVKAYLFVLQYLINDSVEIGLALVYWVRAGFGTRLGSASSIKRHARLQEWSIALMAKRAEQLLDVSVVIDPNGAPLDTPGPTIVIAPHTSLFDASLPGLLYQRHGFDVRGVVMAELLADPGFDLIYGRAGSVFVPRADGPQARLQIAQLAATLEPNSVVGIFPEGRLFGAQRLDRAKQRLREHQPDRASLLAPLAHTLPPRSGGLATILSNCPTADVVLLRHVGLGGFRPFRFSRHKRTGATVYVSPVRFDRPTIPDDEVGVGQWLDEVWLALDRWIDAEQRDLH